MPPTPKPFPFANKPALPDVDQRRGALSDTTSHYPLRRAVRSRSTILMRWWPPLQLQTQQRGSWTILPAVPFASPARRSRLSFVALKSGHVCDRFTFPQLPFATNPSAY